MNYVFFAVAIVSLVLASVAFASWRACLSRLRDADGRAEESREALQGAQAQTDSLRGQLMQETQRLGEALATAQGKTSRVQELEKERDDARRQAADLNAEGTTLKTQLAEVETRIEEERKAAEKNLSLLNDAQEKLSDAFTALAKRALDSNNEAFLDLAKQNLATHLTSAQGDLQKRQEAISALLKPLEQHLQTYQQRLQQTETAQSSALGEVKKQLETLTRQSESLASETQRFRMVLKSNQARGKWGEETLRRVVEAADMSVHCDFVEQVSAEDKKPDLIVKLPGERVIIVDAKVPDLDFISALESADLEKRSQLLKDHADKLKGTIRDLAKRDYPAQFANALDYVVLFLPAESLFSAALEGDRDLIVWAAEKHRIMLATPASLIALLRSVSVSWQQFDQTRNAQKIAEAAQELYRRTATFFTDHFDGIRAGLDKANKAFNDAVGSYERSVRPSGERLAKLGTPTGGKDLPDIQPVHSALRSPAAASDIAQLNFLEPPQGEEKAEE